MKDGTVIRPAGRISTIAEVNEANANRVPIDYGYRGDEPQLTWDDSGELTPAEPSTLKPVAAFNAVVAGLVVTVDGTPSFDPDAPGTNPPLTYEWTWGDGGTSTGKTPAAHTYAANGAKTITLLVTDASGAFGQSSRTITLV